MVLQVRLPREEVYHLKHQKFERDVQYILMLEDQWVGKAVVYRNKDTGTYQLGKFERDVYTHVRGSVGRQGCGL